MNVNKAAAYTVSTLALATGSIALSMIFVQTATATVALGVLTALGTTLSVASVSAWLSLRGRFIEASDKEYFEKTFSHLGIAITAASQFIVQSIVLSAAKVLSQGVTSAVTVAVSQSIQNSLI